MTVDPLGEKEQLDLLDRLTPLLKVKSGSLRSAAARALHLLSDPRDGSLGHRQTRRALPALVAAYKAEKPGPTRDELANAVCALAGPRDWQELSGNPPGLLVCLRELDLRNGQVFFWLSMRRGQHPVHECPTLVLERLNWVDRVLEKKEMPVPVVNLPRPWADGWDGEPLLLVQFPVTGLAPGTWRLSVRGTAGKGKDRMKWTSEPKLLTVKGPRKPGQPPPSSPWSFW